MTLSGTLSSARRDAAKLRKVVARAMADPEARERYREALRERRCRGDAPTVPAGAKRPRCLVCGSRRIGERQVVYKGHKRKKTLVWTCKSCGLTRASGVCH